MSFVVLICQVVERVDVFGNPVFKNPGYKHISNNKTGAPNEGFLANICSEPSRMAKIVESPRTAKNFENVSW